MAGKSSQAQALMATARGTTAIPLQSQGINNWATIYGTGLPRTFDTYRSGDFSPMEPISPNPIDRPEPSGRPRPRRWQFPVGWNLPVGQPGTEGIKLANYQVQRDMAETGSVPRRAVEICKSDLQNFQWSIVPTPAAEKAMQGSPEKRKDFEVRRAELWSWFLDEIDPNYDGFYAWLNALLEDQLVLDAVAIHPLPTVGRGKGPLGSDIAALELIDGATIRPMLNTYGAKPSVPEVAFQQLIWGVPRVDLMDIINLGPNASIEDLKELNPVIDELTETVDEWNGDQLIYLRQNARTWTPYGFSPMEQCLLPASIMMARQTWQWEFYRSGSLPAVFMDPGDMVATAEEARELQEAINMTGGDLGSRHQVIVTPPGAKIFPQKDIQQGDNFDVLMVTEVAMAFGLQISDFGMTPKVSTMQSPIQAKRDAEAALDLTVRRSTLPRIRYIERLLSKLIQIKFGQSDMMFSSGISDVGESPQDVQEMWIERAQNSITSIDETRLALELEPFGEPWSAVPMVFGSNSTLPLPMQIDMMSMDVNPNTKPSAGGMDGPPTPIVDTSPRAAGAQGPASAAHGGARASQKGSKSKKPLDPMVAEVDDYLLETYPDAALDWVEGMDWKKVDVAVKDISVTGPSSKKDMKDIQKKAKKFKKGKPINRIVLVDPHENGLMQVADGHHRVTAAVLAKVKTIPAWVGEPKKKYKGDWRRQIMDMQLVRATKNFGVGAGFAPFDLGPPSEGPTVSGICLMSLETGRVLLLQRALDDDDQINAGKWEFPGGHLEPGEGAWDGALREWQEETGMVMPDDATILQTWRSINGEYECFLVAVDSEDGLGINKQDDRVPNPDDPGGDSIETVAWFSVDQLPGMSGLRSEVRDQTPWDQVMNWVKARP